MKKEKEIKEQVEVLEKGGKNTRKKCEGEEKKDKGLESTFSWQRRPCDCVEDVETCLK